MDFVDSNMLAPIEALTTEQLDDLPFGVIKVDASGAVLEYNTWESTLSGLSPQSVKGKSFFVEVAPCTNNFMVAERFTGQGDLDELLDYVFTYKLSPTKVRLRLLREAGAPHAYVLVQKR